jgi:hypothetical protein
MEGAGPLAAMEGASPLVDMEGASPLAVTGEANLTVAMEEASLSVAMEVASPLADMEEASLPVAMGEANPPVASPPEVTVDHRSGTKAPRLKDQVDTEDHHPEVMVEASPPGEAMEDRRAGKDTLPAATEEGHLRESLVATAEDRIKEGLVATEYRPEERGGPLVAPMGPPGAGVTATVAKYHEQNIK